MCRVIFRLFTGAIEISVPVLHIRSKVILFMGFTNKYRLIITIGFPLDAPVSSNGSKTHGWMDGGMNGGMNG